MAIFQTKVFRFAQGTVGLLRHSNYLPILLIRLEIKTNIIWAYTDFTQGGGGFNINEGNDINQVII